MEIVNRGPAVGTTDGLSTATRGSGWTRRTCLARLSSAGGVAGLAGALAGCGPRATGTQLDPSAPPVTVRWPEGTGPIEQEFLDYAMKLNKRGGERWGFDMGFASLDRNITWIWNNGGEPHDPKDGPIVTRLTYDDPKTIEGLQFLHDFIWKHQVSPTNNDMRGGMNSMNAFLNGKIAIWMNASGDAAGISRDAPGTGLDWDFLSLPKGPAGHGARVSTDGYMMNKATKRQEQTWTVLNELVGMQGQKLRAEIRRLQPPRRSAAELWEKAYPGLNARLGRVMADTARPDARAFWKDADKVGSMIGTHMQATMLRNEVGVAQAMRQAMQEVRGYYASNP